MYLHLGQETVVRLREVVGIFDMENATISKYTRQFLADAEKGGYQSVPVHLRDTHYKGAERIGSGEGGLRRPGRDGDCVYFPDLLRYPAQTGGICRRVIKRLNTANEWEEAPT